jgi:hypothetical protein
MSDPVPFVLEPFGTCADALGLDLYGDLTRRGDHLSITYQLTGNLASLVRPPQAAAGPLRCDELWEHTCFELFLAAVGAEPYWEVNLAPNGHWNLYRLDGYRQGLRPEADREALPVAVTEGTGQLRLDLDLLLPRELAETCRQGPLQLGVTAVIEQRGGTLSYWALGHGGPVADFHRREDFLLRVEP